MKATQAVKNFTAKSIHQITDPVKIWWTAPSRAELQSRIDDLTSRIREAECGVDECEGSCEETAKEIESIGENLSTEISRAVEEEFGNCNLLDRDEISRLIADKLEIFMVNLDTESISESLVEILDNAQIKISIG